MSKVNQEPAVAFAEVSHSVKSSGSLHSSPAFDGRFPDRVPAKSAPGEVKRISFQQIEWLLQGLKIEQEKAHHPVKRTLEKSCF
ncbi:MAG: transposase [Clostridia bacterium]|nr:transposase [Clostridia bacterium]MCI9127736.1 transposase [Eubacterium sp.]NBJ01484.1 hypothetical protein [Lachnospiraceae bacterium]